MWVVLTRGFYSTKNKQQLDRNNEISLKQRHESVVEQRTTVECHRLYSLVSHWCLQNTQLVWVLNVVLLQVTCVAYSVVGLHILFITQKQVSVDKKHCCFFYKTSRRVKRVQD